MKKTTIKMCSVLLAASLAAGAFSACGKKSGGMNIPDAVEEFAEGADQIELADLKDLDEDKDAIQNGVYVVASGDELGEFLEENNALDEMDELTSMIPGLNLNNIIDPENIEEARLCLRGNLEASKPGDLKLGAAICVTYNDAETAADVADDIDNLISLGTSLMGIDSDDLSSEEYFYDEDSGEFNIVLNLDVDGLLTSVFDSLGGMFGDAVTSGSDEPEKTGIVVNLCVRIDGENLLLTISAGEDYTESVDKIHTDAGFDAPSSVENTEELTSALYDFLAEQIASYMFKAFSAMASN